MIQTDAPAHGATDASVPGGTDNDNLSEPTTPYYPHHATSGVCAGEGRGEEMAKSTSSTTNCGWVREREREREVGRPRGRENENDIERRERERVR